MHTSNIGNNARFGVTGHHHHGGSRVALRTVSSTRALASSTMWESLDALSHQLELCAIGPDRQVVLVVDPETPSHQCDLLRAALTRSGADAIEVRSLRSNNHETSQVMSAVFDTADIVITTADHPTQAELSPVARLQVHPIDPAAFPPHANLRRRVQRLATVLQARGQFEVTDHHGSQMVVNLAGSTARFDHGLLGDDQRSASFPAGWVESTPAAGTVAGTLILMPGDGIIDARRLVSSPVRITIEDDHIAEIEGDNPDADVIRALLEYHYDPNAYGVAGITVGMNPGHAPAAGPFDDRLIDPIISRLAAGLITISFGGNLVADRPGKPALTLTLPGRSLQINDLPVVVDGVLDGDFAPDVYER